MNRRAFSLKYATFGRLAVQPAGRLIHAMPESSQEELYAWFNDFKLSVDKIHRPCVGRKEEKFGRLGARDQPRGLGAKAGEGMPKVEIIKYYLKPDASAAFLRGPPRKDMEMGVGGSGRRGRRKRTGGRVETPHKGKIIAKMCAGRPL